MADLAVCVGRPPASLHHGPLSLNRCAQAAGHEAESAPTPDPDVVPEQTGSGTKIGRHRPSATSLTSGARPDLCRPKCGSGRSIQPDGGGAPPAGLLCPEPHASACVASHTATRQGCIASRPAPSRALRQCQPALSCVAHVSCPMRNIRVLLFHSFKVRSCMTLTLTLLSASC